MGGSMAVTQGLLDEFGPERIRNTPISEMAIVGSGHRRRDPGHAPDRRDHVRGLPDDLDGAARQPGGEAPDDVRRPGLGAAHDPDAGRRGLVSRRAARAAARGVVRPRPGPQGRVRVDARGRARPALVAIYDDNPVVFFEHRTLYPIKGEVPEELEAIPLGKARVHREGTDVTVVATGRLVHEALERRGGGGEGRDLRRGRRPADAPAARRGDDRRLRSQDDALRDRPRGRHARRLRRRARGRRSSTAPSTGSTRRSSAWARSSRRSRSRRRSSSGRCRTRRTSSTRFAGRSRGPRAEPWRPRSSSRAWARAWSRARS